MGQQQIQALAERLTTDPKFRSQFQADPQSAAMAAGIELDDSDREALRAEDWTQVADQELATRVTKSKNPRNWY